MSEPIAHPTNENLRIEVTRDEYPSKPYNDGGFPILRLDHTGYGWRVEQDTDLTSYVLPDRLVFGIAALLDVNGTDFVIVERYLRIFWGATFLSRYNSGSYDYLAIDPAHWREHVGIPEFSIRTLEYADKPFEEFEAWVEGNVWMAEEQQRVQREVKTHTLYPDGTTDDGFRSYEEWEATENGSVGGFYGDVDADMQRNMMWQFGWPEAACKHCGEGIVHDVNHGWVCDGVPFEDRGRYTHCVTGVMMHTRGPKHEPKER